MKAARLTRYDDELTVEEVPDPVVSGPHDVLVRVGGAGLCRTDLHILDGMLRPYFEVALPYTLGHETAGWVEEVGSAVGSVRPGDAVILHPEVTCGTCVPCRAGRDMYCHDSQSPGFNTDGGFAAYVRVNERTVVPLHDGQDPAAVAPLADAGLAAYRAVKRAVPALGPGSTVAVLGAGGLGHLAIQILHALSPARVLGVDVTPIGLALATQAGADDVVEGGPSIVDDVRASTDGRGVDAVLDFAGTDTTPLQAVGILAKGGAYHVVGYGGQLSLPTAELVGMELTIAGSCVGTYTELVELMALASTGQVTLQTEQFALDDVNQAVEALRGGRVRGRAVLVP